MNSYFKINSGLFIKGALINIGLQLLAYFLTQILGGPMIFATDKTAHSVSLELILAGLGLVILGGILAFFWPPRSAGLESRLVWPRFLFLLSILFFNLALGFYLKSWLMTLAALPAYAFWRQGQTEFSIKSLAGKLRRENKFIFYAISGVLAFAFIFIFLNFEMFLDRSVVWEKRPGKISFDEPSNVKIPLQFKSPGASYHSYSSISQNIFAEGNSGAPAILENQNYLSIPRLNIKAPIVFASGTGQNELNKALNKGVVLYPGSALPGQNGEVFLTGHSSTYIWNRAPYGQVFSLLDKLEAGDIVSIFYQDRQYDYRITQKEILSPAQTQVSETQNSALALMTCWPPGTTLERLVVRGELIK